MTTPTLRPFERVLVRESAPDGSEYVGTNLALYHRNLIRAARSWRRVSWVDVAAAGWSRPARTLTLRTKADAREVALRVRERSRLPGLVDDHVTAGVEQAHPPVPPLG